MTTPPFSGQSALSCRQPLTPADLTRIFKCLQESRINLRNISLMRDFDGDDECYLYLAWDNDRLAEPQRTALAQLHTIINR